MTQTEYIEILLNDCGFNNREQRNAYLTVQCYRRITHIDDMNKIEKSTVIDDLKQIKENKK